MQDKFKFIRLGGSQTTVTPPDENVRGKKTMHKVFFSVFRAKTLEAKLEAHNLELYGKR